MADQIPRDVINGQFLGGIAQDTNKNGTAGRKTVMTDAVLGKLREAFLFGCNDEDACLYADIGENALYDYQKDHPEFTKQKQAWKNNPRVKARATVYASLSDKDMAKWYLEHKAKDEFGPVLRFGNEEGTAFKIISIPDILLKKDEKPTVQQPTDSVPAPQKPDANPSSA